MTSFHVVHQVPTSPDLLKKMAYARLASTARKIRVAHLCQLFQKFDLLIDDIFEVNGDIWTPKAEINTPDAVIAQITTHVRLLCSLWESVRPSHMDSHPEELARKIADYLDVDAHIGARLQRWAATYASLRTGPPAFQKLENASKELLRMGSGRLRLKGPQTDHALDEVVAAVHAHAPWHSNATTLIWHHLRAARKHGRIGLSLPPLLLHGPPGTGKSTLARIIAQQADVPYIELDVGAGTAAFRIVGVESGWSTRQIGDVVRLVCESKVSNPLIIINEIDKIGTGASSGSGTRTSMSDALLPLLEAGTAGQFRCPASGLDHDLSRVNWVLTANKINHIDPVLRSRLESILVPSLSMSDFDQYIDLMVPADDREVVRQIVTKLTPGPTLTLRHIQRLCDRLSGAEPDYFVN